MFLNGTVNPKLEDVIPHDLRIPARSKIHGKPVAPGVYVAVEEK